MSLSISFDVTRAGPGLGAAGLKRTIDIIGAATLLVLLAPVFALVALLVSMDGGPAVFAHRRIGCDGKPFGCLKFRSMVVGAEECLAEFLALHPDAAAAWHRDQKLDFDPRVTGIGKLLRRTSIDELPQLVNVLRGEMSLVGPRPVTQAELEERYSVQAQLCTSVRPGLTGLWQVSGRNDIAYEERVALDVHYVTRWTLAEDIRILIRTVGVVLDRTGAR
jgi:undecaprenyl-phosphate galactose phosphotransferase